jgi:hypothetical protein
LCATLRRICLLDLRKVPTANKIIFCYFPLALLAKLT